MIANFVFESPVTYPLHKETVGISTCKPTWAAQPWSYKFSKGDYAWARGGNNQWRVVIIEDNGAFELHEGRLVVVYTAGWRKDKNLFKGAFAPLDGDLKPDTEDVRRLFQEDEVRIMD